MIYFALTIIFAMLATYSGIRSLHTPLPTVVSFYFALTSLIIGLITSSSLKIFAVIRLFVYASSGFLVVFMPFFLTVFVLILIRDIFGPKRDSRQTKLDIGIALMLIMMVVFIIWAVFNLKQVRFEYYIDMLIDISLYFMGSFIAFNLLNLVVDLKPLHKSYDVVMVLGQKVDNPNNLPFLMKNRLDRALRIYQWQVKREGHSLFFLVTGGGLEDESLSEADLMRDYLLGQGVEGKQILLERESENTYHNFVYSQALLKATFSEPPAVLVITSRFHLARSLYFAEKTRFQARFEGTPSPYYLLPYYIIRDYLAFILAVKEINYLYLLLIILMGLYHIFVGG